jgi:hypothetical protein
MRSIFLAGAAIIIERLKLVDHPFADGGAVQGFELVQRKVAITICVKLFELGFLTCAHFFRTNATIAVGVKGFEHGVAHHATAPHLAMHAHHHLMVHHAVAAMTTLTACHSMRPGTVLGALSSVACLCRHGNCSCYGCRCDQTKRESCFPFHDVILSFDVSMTPIWTPNVARECQSGMKLYRNVSAGQFDTFCDNFLVQLQCRTGYKRP